jgi:acylphosphatase
MRTLNTQRRPRRCRTRRTRLDDVIRRFLVIGKVQGVFFRQSTRLEAAKLALRGFARNLPDGNVEVLAQGAPSALEKLRAWLQHGPPQARVQEVRETATEDAAGLPQGFDIF